MRGSACTQLSIHGNCKAAHARGLDASSAAASALALRSRRGRFWGLPASLPIPPPNDVASLALPCTDAAAMLVACGGPLASGEWSVPAAVAVPFVRGLAGGSLSWAGTGFPARAIRLTGRASPVAVWKWASEK